MIERHNHGQHYFVLPGGHVEPGETPEQAVIREVHEETGLRVTVSKLLYTSVDGLGNDQRMYLCGYGGDDAPHLQASSSEFRQQQTDTEQQRSPAWFTFEQLRDERVYPPGLLHYLEEDRAINYHHNPYKIVERRV